MRLGSVDGNTTAERIKMFHSGGWFQIFPFLSPKNAVNVFKRKALPIKYLVVLGQTLQKFQY
jgi:hypothetical protein